MCPKTSQCPYCGNRVYHDESLTEGYCTICGKHIYFDSTSERKKYDVIFRYNRSRVWGYGPSINLQIDGDRYVLSSSEKALFKLTEGSHRVVVSGHISAGVNSTDVQNAATINVDRNKSYVVACSNGFSPNLKIQLDE